MRRETGIREHAKVVAKLASILALVLASSLMRPSAKASNSPTAERYLSPIEMALSADGRLIYVVCQSSNELRVAWPFAAWHRAFTRWQGNIRQQCE